ITMLFAETPNVPTTTLCASSESFGMTLSAKDLRVSPLFRSSGSWAETGDSTSEVINITATSAITVVLESVCFAVECVFGIAPLDFYLHYISVLEAIRVSEFYVRSDLHNPLVVITLFIVAVRPQYESSPAEDATGHDLHRDFASVFFFSQTECL